MTTDLIVRNPNISFGSMPPAPVEDAFSKALAETVGAALDNVFGAFRSISFANNCFHLNNGKSRNTLVDPKTGAPLQQLALVVLNVAAKNHCSWWKDAFKQGGEGTPPDAVWYQGDPVPENVPEWVLTTKKDGKFKHYQVKRRTIVALLGQGENRRLTIESETPYVMDLGESSLFMPDAPPLFGFMGFLKLCQQFKCLPLNMLLNLQFNYVPNVAPNTVRFSPAVNQEQIDPNTGQPAVLFFAPEVVASLRQAAVSPSVLQMLEIKTGANGASEGQPEEPMSPGMEALAGQAGYQQPAQAAPVQAQAAPVQAQAAPVQAQAQAAPVQAQAQAQAAPVQAQAAPVQAQVQATPAGVGQPQPLSAATAELLNEAYGALGQTPQTEASAQAAPAQAAPAQTAPAQAAPAQAAPAQNDVQAALAANMNELMNGL